MSITIRQSDRVEILTLQDNTIDLTSQDNSAVVQRAMPLKGLEVRNSILAEHGFSALVTIAQADAARTLLFDFGFSEHGAAFNADALGVDLGTVEALALSHGHLDHVGGMAQLVERTGKTGLPLFAHPEVFRNPRYMKITEDFKIFFPAFTREKVKAAKIELVEAPGAHPMLDGAALFLGEIRRTTDFEKGAPSLFFEKDGKETQDTFEDDTAVVFNVRDKGLVVLSGCAHAGIINTTRYATEVTGVEKIFAIMGGFHLGGPGNEELIQKTVAGLADLDPDYIVPTHCTGRQAVMAIEQAMPEKFILNMSGTKLTFAA